MTDHTPGPWSVSCVRTRESGEPVLQILGADGKCYAMVFYSDRKPGEHAASYADARLIAAAPDMMKALQGLIKAIEDGDLFETAAQRNALRFAFIDGRKAIAKTKGAA